MMVPVFLGEHWEQGTAMFAVLMGPQWKSHTSQVSLNVIYAPHSLDLLLGLVTECVNKAHILVDHETFLNTL